MKYIKNNTQEGRILNLLRQKGSAGVYVYELQAPKPQGEGIAQYNARIWGLRKKGYNITNVVPGHFVLVDSPSFVDSKPAEAIVEPQKQAHDPESCQIDDHYHEYIKYNKKFWRHVEEASQLII